ncbi:MAG: sensor histidine kinase [Candidatus Competibacter denitrificans]
MISLQTRLSASLMGVLGALTALIAVTGSYSLHRIAENFVASRLEHDLEAVLTALSFDAAGHPQLTLERINVAFQRPYSGHYYRIETPNGQLRSRSLWDADLALPPLAAERATRTFTAGPEGQRLLLVGRAFVVQDQPIMIAVTEDFTPLESGLKRLLWRLGGFVLLAFGALLLLQRLMVRRCLAPLEDVRRELPRLERGEIARLSVRAPAEILPLVAELNRLLDLMGQRQRRTRQALGNLAHALKTPLTALTQLVDQPPPAPDNSGFWQDLRQQLAQIRRLTERELKRARIVGAGNPGQRVLLAREVADLIETLHRIHRDRALHFEVRIPPDSVFPGDRDDLLELLGNLLDNACQWANRVIRLTVGTESEQLWLRVEDDGPGCPPEQLASLRQRGVRIDESRAGHGLGLAISSDIVAQYSGQLNLASSETLGGLLAEAVLPISPPTGPC